MTIDTGFAYISAAGCKEWRSDLSLDSGGLDRAAGCRGRGTSVVITYWLWQLPGDRTDQLTDQSSCVQPIAAWSAPDPLFGAVIVRLTHSTTYVDANVILPTHDRLLIVKKLISTAFGIVLRIQIL